MKWTLVYKLDDVNHVIRLKKHMNLIVIVMYIIIIYRQLPGWLHFHRCLRLGFKNVVYCKYKADIFCICAFLFHLLQSVQSVYYFWLMSNMVSGVFSHVPHGTGSPHKMNPSPVA